MDSALGKKLKKFAKWEVGGFNEDQKSKPHPFQETMNEFEIVNAVRTLFGSHLWFPVAVMLQACPTSHKLTENLGQKEKTEKMLLKIT